MSAASPTIQNKIDRPPRLVHTPPPTFRTNAERDRYYAEEKVKWLEGDPKSGLTGPHYWHIQNFPIKDAYGLPMYPLWRDVDDLVYETYAEAFRITWDPFYLKRREFGLSTIFGGSLPLYTASMNPGSTSLLTSADKDRLGDMFTNKLMFGYENLHPDIKSPKANIRQGQRLFLAQEEGKRKAEKRWTGLQSQIVGKETVKTPTSLEAFRALYGFLDEIFLHPKALEVHASAARCFMKGFRKVGLFVLGGTCGIGDTEGVKFGKDLYKNSKDMRILTCFIRGTMGIMEAEEFDKDGMPTGRMLNFCPNGWSDEARAYEWIMRRREQLEKAENKLLYWKFVSDYPLTVEEILNMAPDAILPQQILFMLNEAEKKIAEENIIQQPYDLFRDSKTQLVQAKPAKVSLEKAKFVIIHMPEPGETYGSGTDPMPFGNADEMVGSDYATVIKRKRDQRHVAYYNERNMDPEEVVRNAIMLQDLYGIYLPAPPKTMLELTRGETAMKTYQDLGRAQDLLCETPQHLGIKFEKRKYPWGISKNPHVEARAAKFFLQWMYKHAGNIRLKLLIEQCRHYLKLNHDLLDAVIMELFDMENELAKTKKTQSQKIVPIQIPEMYRDAQGVTHRRFKDVNVVKTVGDLMDRLPKRR